MSLLSVIVPIYNKEKQLETCLRSIINQSYTNIDIICIDDGSSDGSVKIVQQYQKYYDNITLIKHGKNKSLLQARLTGIKNAKTEYVTHIDADDEIRYNYIENMVQQLDDEHKVVFSGIIINFPEHIEIFDYYDVPHSFTKDSVIPNFRIDYSIAWSHCTRLLPIKCYDKILQIIPEDLYINMAEDMLLTLLTMDNYNGKIKFVNDVSGYIYNMGDLDSITNKVDYNKTLPQLRCVCKILKENLSKKMLMQMKNNKLLQLFTKDYLNASYHEKNKLEYEFSIRFFSEFYDS